MAEVKELAMPKKEKLTPPDWGALTGGGGEDEWQADRFRKFGRIKAMAPAIAQLQDHLASEGALYRCSRRILRKYPSAADWYVALACFAGKTLTNLQQAAKTDYKLSMLPRAFVKSMLTRPDKVSDDDLDAFSRWVNRELEVLIGDGLGEERIAGLHVAMIMGGRIVGQGQNEGGGLAVVMLKRALIDHFGPEDNWRFRPEDDKVWRNVEDDLQAALSAPLWFHNPSETLLDFRLGGNRPDVKVTREGVDKPVVLLVGEIKGRKDISNTWESWIPQVSSHMESWSISFPNSYRGVFMTVFTEGMITGRTTKGKEKRRGLKKLHEEKLLDYAINLSLLVTEDEGTVERFCELWGKVLGV